MGLARSCTFPPFAALETSSGNPQGVIDARAEIDFTREPVLLKEAFTLMGRLPFKQIDCLVVGECGKNYSGAGIDPNVVGRLLIEAHPHLETNEPSITRMCVLDISPDSGGNGTGIGIADLTTSRALKAIWSRPFEMNNLTARFLWRSKLPIGFGTDRECIANGVPPQTCQRQKRACVIDLCK